MAARALAPSSSPVPRKNSPGLSLSPRCADCYWIVIVLRGRWISRGCHSRRTGLHRLNRWVHPLESGTFALINRDESGTGPAKSGVTLASAAD